MTNEEMNELTDEEFNEFIHDLMVNWIKREMEKENEEI